MARTTALSRKPTRRSTRSTLSPASPLSTTFGKSIPSRARTTFSYPSSPYHDTDSHTPLPVRLPVRAMNDINEDHAWGLLISVAPSSHLKLANSFVNQGEADHAMEASAATHLAPSDTASLMQRRVDVRDQHGSVKVRSEIVPGTLVHGKFNRHEEIDGLGDIHITPTSDPEPGSEKPIVPIHEQDQERPPSSDEEALWCTCCERNDGSLMITCESEECPVVWFHGRCVG